ncbi:MAG: MFS transporter [Gaiellaceae bacterium]
MPRDPFPPDPFDPAAAEQAVLEEPSPSGRPGRYSWVRTVAVDTEPLRVSPPFRRLWLGQAISYLGSEITFVAIPVQMYELTHSTLQVGLLGVTDLVPLLTVPIVGGAIADVVDRRRLLLVSVWTAIAATGALLANAALPHPQVGALYAINLIAASAFALLTPAERSLVPALVGPQRIAAASALESVYRNFDSVAGPALAGVTIAAIGLTGAYALDLGTFAAALWAVVGLPPALPAEAEDRVSVRSILDGFRYVKTRRELLGIFLVDTNAMIFGMPMALFPAIGAKLGGTSVVGLLYAAPGAGALAAALVSGWATRMRRQGLGVIMAAALWGVAIVAFGFARALWLALILLALAGAADFVSAVLRSAIALAATPDAMRGRVTGIEFAQVASAPSLGNVEAGAVASVTSLRFSVVSGGVACVVGTALLAAAIPELLRYDSRKAVQA